MLYYLYNITDLSSASNNVVTNDVCIYVARGRVYDRRNEEIHHYPDVPDIFQRLQNLQIPIAFASRYISCLLFVIYIIAATN